MLVVIHEAGTGHEQAIPARHIEDVFSPEHPSVTGTGGRRVTFPEDTGSVVFWKNGPSRGLAVIEMPEAVARLSREAISPKVDKALLNAIAATVVSIEGVETEVQQMRVAFDSWAMKA